MTIDIPVMNGSLFNQSLCIVLVGQT